MNKTTIKFNIAGVGIAILGVIALYTVRYFNPENRQIREAERLIEELKRQEREDPYGGTTPEETLRLFIEALKKGDVELASRFYIISEQEKQQKKLATFSKEEIGNIIIHVQSAQKGEITVKLNRATFSYTKKIVNGFIMINDKKISVPSGDAEQTIEMIHNLNNIWKIISL